MVTMKPPTSTSVNNCILLLLLVAGMMTEEVAANGHQHGHKRGHHEGHHHHPSEQHHERRSLRTRREQVELSSVAGSGDGMPGTDTPLEVIIQCKDNTECTDLINSYCDTKIQQCACLADFPIKDNDHSHCVKEAKLNTTCQFSSQCEESDEYSLCGPASICVCQEGYRMEEYPNIGYNCVSKSGSSGPGALDPAMIGVLAGLALMFIIICVVLRLFSKARFRENRSIFNTPNPRLMNASLFKDMDVTGGRRGSALSAVSATGSASASPGGQAAPKTSPSKDPKTKSETTVAIETVD
ncbi:uncharacterized protein jus isoform X3 [Procambarus clarkii]|uniref:uncharacterized protein jus isoform X3 n=1 Tax=Procambarus clarkii TaxID=6728 RepID=UPI001E6788C5|nr:uncharacterized protein LOC123762603 isoform X3 [Procambarus clarkii]